MVVTNPLRGQIEDRLRSDGLTSIIGVDEVGKGCIAGPVVAAAVIIDYQKLSELPAKTKELIRDSKTLSHAQRLKIKPEIFKVCKAWGIGASSPREIEVKGISAATFLAMKRSLRQLPAGDITLIDGNQKIPRLGSEQRAIVKGDHSTFCIASASIIAKEHRDELMRSYAQRYQKWGFDTHVGYGTKHHTESIKKFGICPLHRRNFAPIKELIQ